MALILKGVDDPQKLYDAIFAAARSQETGEGATLQTWSVVTRTHEGKEVPCLIHIGNDKKDSQWEEAGAFRGKPDVANGELDFYWHGGKGEKYGYIHGRLLEQLAAHYGDRFKWIEYKDKRPSLP